METINSFKKTKLSSGKQGFEKVLHSRILIFAMLFGVTGFLGLPILWMSPSFSRLEKFFWSVVNILYTSGLIAICIAICWWALNRINSDLSL